MTDSEQSQNFDSNGYILVIDDHQDIRKTLKEILHELGFKNIIQETNGQRAFELLQKSEHTVQLIFSDWRMSGLTGLGLLVRVRASPKLETIPFVMITGGDDENYVKFAAKAGVDAYLLKPFTSADVREKLDIAYQRSFARSRRLSVQR